MSDARCPVCEWTIETPVTVETPDAVVTVCCEACAEQVRRDATTDAARSASG